MLEISDLGSMKNATLARPAINVLIVMFRI